MVSVTSVYAPLSLGIVLVGIFGNISLITVTLITKQFRVNRCSILLALIAFCDLILELSTVRNLSLALLQVSVSKLSCFYFMISADFCLCVQTFLMLSIAVDRLIAIVIPVWYKTVKPVIYFPISCFLPVFFGFLIIVLGFFHAEGDMIIPICNVPLSMGEPVYCLWNRISIGAIWITILIYVAAGIALLYKGTQRLLKPKNKAI
ncbi:hypothetical protein L596_013091 [Steinernema carpocapsae]|uniref:G-protein coupled receptors family 1 profile domain-containing protein n=1 Tax=Steinernema carpocapsae TaxID=34508 RepID=A0A4U5NZ34_STECR|nr:hypothetical protein L596_013091 [Steinernema carpocapsae]